MKNELLEKIISLAKIDSPAEVQTQHLFTCARKLIEHVSPADKPLYSTLKLYSDWTVHTAIDRSPVGAIMLEEINGFVHKVAQGGGTSSFGAELSRIFLLERARGEFNRLLESEGATPELIGSDFWKKTVPHLLEIIADCPLKLDVANKRFADIVSRMRKKPIRGSSIVCEAVVTKELARDQHGVATDERIFCVSIKTDEPITLRTPLLL